MFLQRVKRRLATAAIWLMVAIFALPATPAFGCKCLMAARVSCCCCTSHGLIPSGQQPSCCSTSSLAVTMQQGNCCKCCKCGLFCPCNLAKRRLPDSPAPTQDNTPDKELAESCLPGDAVLDTLPSFRKCGFSDTQVVAFCSPTERCIFLSRFLL